MARCWFCGKVKGKRSCPARGGELICSRCCGTKRQVEIHCPSDCSYLHGAHDSKWESASRQKEEARFLSHFVELGEEQLAFAFFLHHVMLSARSKATSLDDAELEDLLETASKTLRTQSKGVLYRHPAGSPHLQPMADWLVRVLTERERIEGAPRANDDDVRRVLDTVLEAVREHRRRGAARESYLVLAERVLGQTLAGAPPIEIPDAPEGPPGNLLVTP